MILLSDEWGQVHNKILIERVSERALMTQLWELLIDCFEDLHVVDFDVFQVLLFKLFFTLKHFIMNLDIGLRVSVLFPVFEKKMVLLFVAETFHHSQKQLGHHQCKHLFGLTLK